MPIFESGAVKSLQEVNAELVLLVPLTRTYSDGYPLALRLICCAL